MAIVTCRTYGSEVQASLEQAFDLLGGIGGLVQGKTVTVKLNLTGTDFTPVLGVPVGESYMTHFATALALGRLLFKAGARRVRYVESTQSRAGLDTTLGLAGWDVGALRTLGRVEFENTRNLGRGKQYAELRVPGEGYLFSRFLVNHCYAETDVLVSLAKLKQHLTTGITGAMKNLFGMTPNAVYGDEAGREDATGGRGPLHGWGWGWNARAFADMDLPGSKRPQREIPNDAGYRVPRIVADLCAARPIHLAVVDGISSMTGGEGPWCRDTGRLTLVKPGVLVVGLNPVATDAVGTAVMGFANPRAPRGSPPFRSGDNHLLLAAHANLGTADLDRVEVLGKSIAQARCPYTQAVHHEAE